MTEVHTGRALVTAEEFWRLCADGHRRELVHGKVVPVSPVGGSHGDSVVRLLVAVATHVRTRDLGWVSTEVGFVLARDPDLVRGPDVAFVTRARVPAPIPSTFVELAPDLVVEVVSPGDTFSEVFEKVREYLAHGVREAWVVDGRSRRLFRQRGSEPMQVLGPDDVLTTDLLPGLSLRVSEVL
jgi:Uma2 family endonuclease